MKLNQPKLSRIIKFIGGVTSRVKRVVNPVSDVLNTVSRYVDPLLMVILSVLFCGALVSWLWSPFYRWITAHKDRVVFAAGNKDGASYAMMTALGTRLLEKYPNDIEIEVLPTKGTIENLELLSRDPLKGKIAHIAAAQADVALRYRLGRNIALEGAGRVLAAIHLDKFQLLACEKPTKDNPGPVLEPYTVFSRKSDEKKPKIRKVRLPLGGGQEDSFVYLAQKFKLRLGTDYQVSDDSGKSVAHCGSAEYGHLMFRVRAEGHSDVSDALARKWRFVNLERASTVWSTDPTLIQSEILPGRFEGDRFDPRLFPDVKLSTVAVPRLLLAREDKSLPSWVVHALIRILRDETAALAKKVGPKYEDLVLGIPKFNQKDRLTSLGIPLHPDAAKAYDPTLRLISWYSDRADLFSLVITVIMLASGGILAMNRWLVWWRRNNVSGLVRRVTHEMAVPNQSLKLASKVGSTTTDTELEPEEKYVNDQIAVCEKQLDLMKLASEAEKEEMGVLLQALAVMHLRLAKLSELYAEASELFVSERISEESFSSFNETYRSALESVLRESEEKKRAISEFFVVKFMNVVRQASRLESEDIDDKYIDLILNEASELMSQKLIYSRDSFRTLTDAYELASMVVKNARARVEVG